MKNQPENNVDKYIANAPEEIQVILKDLRSIIQNVAPKATERTDYFQMPGYSYDQYKYYNGMFVWFSFKNNFVRLHVLPQAIEKYKRELKDYKLTKLIKSYRGC